MKLCEKIKSVFYLFMSLTLVLTLTSCDEDSNNNGKVIEQGRSAYVYLNNNLYYPDGFTEGTLSVYDEKNYSSSTFFGRENTANSHMYYNSIASYGKNLYCSLGVDEHGSSEFGNLVKIDVKTGEYSELNYRVYDLLWQADDTAYFCGREKDDDESRNGIYKLNMSDDSVTLVYTDDDANVIKGSKKDIYQYTFNGLYKIFYIDGNTIYFVKMDSNKETHTICTIQTNGKEFKEYFSANCVYNMFPLGDRIYFYGWLGKRDSGWEPIVENYYITGDSDTAENAEIGMDEILRLYNGYIYGFNGVDFCRVPAADTKAEPQVLFSYRGKITEFCGDWIISEQHDGSSQVNQAFHAIKCDGSEQRHFDILVDAYKFAYCTVDTDPNTSDSNNEPSSEVSTTQAASKYDSIKSLLSKSKKELYDGYEIPEPIGSYEGSEIYKAPDSESIYYYFPLGKLEEYSYPYAVNVPISLIFEGKAFATISDLKEEFGDKLIAEYSDYLGGYYAGAEYDGLSFDFGMYGDEETATFETVTIKAIS